jgi:hypothetical protein
MSVYHDISARGLELIRNQEKGVFFLTPDCYFGVDVKFKKDAMVLINKYMPTLPLLQQAIGRSSRSRGVSKGVYYPLSGYTPFEIEQQLMS